MKSTHRPYRSLVAEFVLVAIVLIVSSVAFWSFLRTDEDSRDVNNSRDIVHAVQSLLSQMLSGQFTLRDYVREGDDSFPAAYLARKEMMNSNLEVLHKADLTAAARLRVKSIVPQIHARLDEIDRIVEAHGQPAADAGWLREPVRQLELAMIAIQGELIDFLREEEGLLEAREARLRSTLRYQSAAFLVAIAFVLVLLAAFIWLITRRTQARIEQQVHQDTLQLLSDQETLNGELASSFEKLRESENKLEVTLDSIGDAVLATDANARITLLNKVAERLTGWSQTEALGRPVDEIFRIIKKESREVAVVPVLATLTHGTIQGLANHTVLIARDGREYDIADSCAAIRRYDGTIVGAVLVFRNVSEEYAAQQAVRDSTAQIHAILNTVVDGIVTLDAGSDVIETVNPAAERMFGYSAAELRGKSFRLLIPELDQVQNSVSIDYYSAGDDARSNGHGREVLGHCKDGTSFPLEMVVSEMWLNGKRYFTSVLRNITVRMQIEDDRKKLDQRLRDQHFYVRSLIESSIDAMMTCDPAGIISDVNKQMEVLTGSTRDELIGAPFKNFFTEPRRAEAAIQRALIENKVRDYELTANSKSGKETEVSFYATTYYNRDRVLQGVFASVRDVTDRKQLTQVLLDSNIELERAKSIAEAANLAKSEFLSSMSHELRTPLSAILGFAQLIDLGVPPPTPVQKRSVEQILKAGWYLLELINEVLDLAVVESGNLQLSMEPVHLSEIMQSCEEMIQPQARQRDIKVLFEPDETPYFVLADRVRLKQVLINLLSNAIKYNRPAGSVVVKCVPRDGERLRIEIRDTGEGLPHDKLHQLFQSFNRLGQEGGEEEGTGIGLVVSKRLVELMNGSIGADSIVGTGSVFWIELGLTVLPAFDAGVDEVHSNRFTEAPPGSAVRTLLYVEDNAANLMLVEDLLSRRPGIRLLTASAGDTGVEIARTMLPDVILMDINLPGISGLRAMQILAADPLTAQIPVIALSANAMPGDIRKGLEAGFYRYLTKPIKVLEFFSTLDETFETASKRRAAGQADQPEPESC